MKTAICMYGKAGGLKGKDGIGGTVDLEACYRSYYKKVFSKNPKPDIFIHCWSPEERDRIEKLYQPIVSFYENPLPPPDPVSKQFREYLTMSRWLSTKRSLLLKQKWEKTAGEKYDCVMILRFDSVFHRPLIFSDYDLQYFWAGLKTGIQRPGEGKKAGLWLQDFWFFSNSKTMDYLGTMSDNLLSKNSHKAVHAHMQKFGEIKIAMECPRDFDLYRWWAKTSNDYPKKYYDCLKKND